MEAVAECDYSQIIRQPMDVRRSSRTTGSGSMMGSLREVPFLPFPRGGSSEMITVCTYVLHVQQAVTIHRLHRACRRGRFRAIPVAAVEGVVIPVPFLIDRLIGLRTYSVPQKKISDPRPRALRDPPDRPPGTSRSYLRPTRQQAVGHVLLTR